MTIRKGEAWGAPGPLAPDAPVFEDDRSAARHLAGRIDELGAPGADIELGLVGGDLHRTLGSPRHRPAELRGPAAMRFPVDVAVVRTDAGEDIVVAHVVASLQRSARTGGPRWFTGRTVAVMNAEFVDGLDLSPRGHPDDGRLDVTDGALPAAQRRAGRRRARSGTHVPHPGLREARVRRLDVEISPASPLHVWLDGEHIGRSSTLSVRCVPDALTVVV